jgi:hypothetical protein
MRHLERALSKNALYLMLYAVAIHDTEDDTQDGTQRRALYF